MESNGIPATVLELAQYLSETRGHAVREMAFDEVEAAPALRAAIARRTLTLLWYYGLINQDADEFSDKLRSVAELLHVPYVELWLGFYQGCVSGEDVTRAEMAEWMGWCQQHAPERLTAQKGGG